MKKRLLAMFLALVMCLALLPTAALAAEEFEMDGTVLKEYYGSDVAVTIPDGVTSIGESAFSGCTGLTSVTIPDSVTSIGNNAFTSCTDLTSVTIPDSVTSIGEQAFSYCTGLTDMTIPDSVTSIGELTFYGCTGLTSVTIPNSVTSIGICAFDGCTGLTSVTIPNSVTSIGQGAFQFCKGLTSVTIPGSVTSIGRSAFVGCTGLTSVTIPNSVTSIESSAFGGCTGLKDVYYGGSEAQWKAIDIGSLGNAPLTAATIHYNSPMPDQPTTPDKPVVPTTALAIPTNDELTVDGQPATPAAYKIDGTNYFKLRDVAVLLGGTKSQFSVDWDASANAAAITTGQPYTRLPTDLQGKPTVNDTASLSGDVIYINGVKADLTIYKINGDNYFKLRDLGKALGFNVGWAADRGMFIESDKPYDPNN